MPILFVHGVSTRLKEGRDQVWEEIIRPKLKEYIAPVISNDPDNILIEEVYWGDVSVPFYGQERHSLPKRDRVEQLYESKKTWLKNRSQELWQKINDGQLNTEDIKYVKYLLPAAKKRLSTLGGFLSAEVFKGF